VARSEQKEETRRRILAAAGRGFRRGGFGGIGVDGLAKEAGVTSGAFYVHFDSKADAFREAAIATVSEVHTAIQQLQAAQPGVWWEVFVRFYLGPKRKCNLDESCGMQSLAPEVARADDASRAGFQEELLRVAQAVVDGPAAPHAPRDLGAALAALATLSGAVTLARAVQEPRVADQIARSAEALLLPAARPAPDKSRTGVARQRSPSR
jgi:TetR/AcrR family transcriptional regulator, transcriptional repressor for nem operon